MFEAETGRCVCGGRSAGPQGYTERGLERSPECKHSVVFIYTNTTVGVYVPTFPHKINDVETHFKSSAKDEAFLELKA